MEIRAAEASDAPALEQLFAQWGHPLALDDVTVQVQRWSDTPSAELWVAVVDGDVAGLAAVTVTPRLGRVSRTARLMGLVVGERHRRQGLGRALLDHATEHARACGCDQLELTSSRARDEAHGFYEALGYTDTSGTHARYVRPL